MYDAIILADVLEHIADPLPVLRLAHNLLKKPSGKLVLSLPKVRHLSVLFGLIIRGDWKYKPSGILDQTHLRFLTTKSAHRLLTESGFTAISMQRWGVLRLARTAAKFVSVLGEFFLRLIFIVPVPNEAVGERSSKSPEAVPLEE
jgi:2-polyprenyl-3-methyl-5-hydroxy-6-metoxy-1,4-benzoquinol methylase